MRYNIALVMFLILFGCKKESATQNTIIKDCDSSRITYSGKVKPILKTNCYNCHSTAATANNPSMDFENFANLKTYMDLHFHLDTTYGSQFYNNILHTIGSKAMPPDKKMSACEIRTIKLWIDAGALEN